MGEPAHGAGAAEGLEPAGWCVCWAAVPLEGGLTPSCGEGEAQALFQGLVFWGGPTLVLETPSGGSAHDLLDVCTYGNRN